MRPCSEFISVNGLQHHILHWNRNNYDKNKPPLVLLHGFNQTCHSWDTFAQQVGLLGFWSIVPDKRGMGQSDKAKDYKGYHRDILVDDVYRIIKHYVENNQKVIVFGMSMGAVHTIVLSVKYPLLIDKIVIIDNAPKVKQSGSKNIVNIVIKTWKTFNDAVNDVMIFNKYRTRENVIDRLKYSLQFNRFNNNKWGWKFDTNYFIASMKWTLNEPPEIMWNKIKQIKCKTLMVYGENSDLITTEIAKKILTHLQKGQLVKINNAGHAVIGDNPQEFYEKVVPFILNGNRSKL